MGKVRIILHSVLLTMGGICGVVLLASLGCYPLAESGAFPATVERVNAEISLPHKISGTELVVRNFVSYEGSEFVSEIMAVVLENVGTDWIAYASVQMEGSGIVLDFQASMLPPGSSTLVLDSQYTTYGKIQVSACRADVSYLTGPAVPEVKYEPVDMAGFYLINTGEQPYSQINVYYKAYDAASGLFLGGLTWQETVRDLLPGEKRLVKPEYYAGKYTRILIMLAE